MPAKDHPELGTRDRTRLPLQGTVRIVQVELDGYQMRRSNLPVTRPELAVQHHFTPLFSRTYRNRDFAGALITAGRATQIGIFGYEAWNATRYQ